MRTTPLKIHCFWLNLYLGLLGLVFVDIDISVFFYFKLFHEYDFDNRNFPPTPVFLSVSEFACHIAGCRTVFSTLEEYEHHYNSLHRHVCCSCRRSLPSARLLDIHIQEWHDSLFTILAQKQDMVSQRKKALFFPMTSLLFDTRPKLYLR